ncbi:hypothetical protein HID58_057088 [Brassica napus]|uniref:Replication protein A 70 kDa DNA-binding subunit B/D first OB fold domain-containing protein n=1 Tax=Brassica napus TaxID=3708 RepID=A0ABQ8AQ44_BRANA|nr:hypothetical protein HID58_057088 [Brassica napus]
MTMERKKRKGRTPEGVCNGRVSELISQTQISSAIDDEIQSSKVSSKRGVRIGSEYVFYNPHIQKLARAQRRLRLSEKRGQLHKKTDPLPHRPETLDRAARAHRREIISTKRQNPVSANHPIVATEENSLTIASDGIDTTNNVDNYSKRTSSAPNTDERCTENDSLYYGQKNTGQSSVELLGRSCSANKHATQRENLPLPVTKKRKTNPQNVFADITNVNLGCVRGDTRRGETLEVMGQKRIHMEDSQTVFRWRRGWQSNVSSGSVVTSLRDLNGPLHSSQTCQNLPNVQAPIIPSRSQTKETMTENQCLLLGPEEEGVRLSSRKAKQKGIFLGVSSYASSKPLQFTPDPGSVITQVQPSQSTEQDLHEAEGRSYIISDIHWMNYGTVQVMKNMTKKLTRTHVKTLLFCRRSSVKQTLISGNSGKAKIRPDLVESIMEMLRECNVHLPLKNPVVRVKVISKWKDASAIIRGETQMLMGDEKGNTVLGTIVDEIMIRNECIMFEGEWYEIHGFKLMYNFRRFRVTTNRFHVFTGENTIINNVPARTDCNYYGFKEFKTILRGLAHPMYSVDVYGAMVSVGDLEHFGAPGGPMIPKMRFSLVNPGYKHLNCVAYGRNAVEIDAYWNYTRANVVLCVLSFWQIERLQGRLTFITNIEGCSRIEFELNIPEIIAFRQLIPPNAY